MLSHILPIELCYTVIKYALTPKTYYKICLISKSTKKCVDDLMSAGAHVFQTPHVMRFFADPVGLDCEQKIKVGNIALSKYGESVGAPGIVYEIILPDMSSIQWGNRGDGVFELDTCNYLSDIPNHEFLNNTITWISRFLPNYTNYFLINIRACDCGLCIYSHMKETDNYIPTPLLSNLNIRLSPKSQNKSYESLIGDVRYNNSIKVEIQYIPGPSNGWYEHTSGLRRGAPQGNFQWLMSEMALKLI